MVGGGAAPAVTLSGTVAGGAAVIGTVLVTDSLGATKGGTIEANGSYLIDVSGMTAPFVLKAAGTVGDTSVTYYSAATAADVGGTVNITPFTNLIVSNIAAQLAENYFSDPANLATIGTLITPVNLAAAETALQAKLQPILTALGISDSIDLLRTSFAADHSGIDAVLDLVKVEVDLTTNVATLKNALTQQTIATDNATSSSDDATVVDTSKTTELNSTTATDLQTVISKLSSFAALFATSLPTPEALAASGAFDTSSNFMMSGATFDQFATEMSTQQSAIGLKFSNVALTLGADGVSATLTALITSNTAGFEERIQLKMAKVDGVWKVQGDGRIANVGVSARAERNDWVSLSQNYTVVNSGAFMRSGLHIWIDPFAYNSNYSSNPIARALITGPGLGSGVTMVPDTQNTWMKVEEATYSENLAPECGVSVNNGPAPTSQCVTIAQAVDNSKYTVILKDSSGNSLNDTGYEVILSKQPYTTNALTTALFPTITSILIDGQEISLSTLVANKTVSVGWTMPSSLLAKEVNIGASTFTGASYFWVGKSVAPTDTSALIGLGTPLTSGTVTNGWVWLRGRDVFGRDMTTTKSMSVVNP